MYLASSIIVVIFFNVRLVSHSMLRLLGLLINIKLGVKGLVWNDALAFLSGGQKNCDKVTTNKAGVFVSG
jgi:hypothetical protein